MGKNIIPPPTFRIVSSLFWTLFQPYGEQTYKLEHVPVKDVVVGEALSVEEVPEKLAEVRVVGFIVKSQRAAEVQVRCKLR